MELNSSARIWFRNNTMLVNNLKVLGLVLLAATIIVLFLVGIVASDKKQSTDNTIYAAKTWAKEHNKVLDTCIKHDVGVGKYYDTKLFCHVKNLDGTGEVMLHYDVGSEIPYEIVKE